MSGRQRELTMRFLAEPTDVNYGGKVHGGQVMKWIDQAGYAAAVGWSGKYSVTVAVGGIRFVAPIRISDLVTVETTLVHTGTSSMHFAVGSATVAMISAAGMVLPMLGAHPTVSKEIICIAIGAGAIGWTHVTDSAFWVVKEYLGVSLIDALKKFTLATVLASLIALGLTLLLSHFV